jgi:hypothetical protein
MLTTKSTPLQAISGLRPIQSASAPGHQSRNHTAQQHRRDDQGKLAGVKARGGLQIRKRSADDTNVHTVEQPAQTRHQ